MNCIACPASFGVRILRRRRKMSAAADSAETTAGSSSTREGWPLNLETFTNQLCVNTITCIGKTRIGTRCRRLLSTHEKAEAAAELDLAKLHCRIGDPEAARGHFENIVRLCSCNHHNSQSMMNDVVEAWMSESERRQEQVRRPARTMSYREARESVKDLPIAVEDLESTASAEVAEQPARPTIRSSCHHAAKRRSTDDECEICKEPLEDKKQNVKLVWCKGSCGRNYHIDCYSRWIVILATARIPKTPECPYCRQPWSTLR